MGIFDSIKGALDGHEAEAEQAVDQVGDLVDQNTGGQYSGQVDQAQQFLKDQIGASGDAQGGAQA